MASQGAYEGGGIGGKLRRRALRRAAAAAATPYDRPPTAVRGNRVGGGGGWLSKLVDPASRIITGGASRIFSSVFSRGFPPALPAAAAPEANLRSRDVEVVDNNASSEVHEQEARVGEKPIHNPEAVGFSDLEQLLKQKTFTRVEFDRLSELLRSRTMESGSSEPGINYKAQENANVFLRENGAGSSKLYGNISTPAGRLTILEEEVASPAEIAKAYMGSRPSKVSPSSLSLRNQVLQQEPVLRSNTPFAEKLSDLSVPTRSTVRFSGISEPPENGYLTPRARGRSAIYKMSRSPYFKAQSTSNIKGEVPAWNGYSGPSMSSQWSPTAAVHSGGKQVLKRRSSVLDDDIGSFGPIRRIRQKSNLISPMKDRHSSVSGNLPSQVAPLSKDGSYGSTSSMQKLVSVDVQNRYATVSQDAGNGDDKGSHSTVTAIPPQSSEMARKILQQLDKLVPSPGKSTELKANARNESSSKLTLDMLHGRALRSMEDIDSSKFLTAQRSRDAEARSDTDLPNLCQKQANVEENGHLKVAVSGVNVTPETGGRENAITSGQISSSVMRTGEFVLSDSEAVPPRKKPAFQISALEDLPEMDDDDSNIKDVSASTTVRDKLESGIADSKSVPCEALSDKSPDSYLQNLTASSPILRKEVDAKSIDGPALVEKPSFSFPVAPDTSYSQPPPTPTIPIQLPDNIVQQTEQTATPVFSFGHRDAIELKFTSTATGVSDSAGLKFGSSNSSTTTLMESSNSNRGDITQKTTDIPKLTENSTPSGTPTPTMSPAIVFGASTTPTLNNGSISLPSSAFSVSMPFKTSSDAPTGVAFSSSTIAATSSTNQSISSSAPVSSTFPAFKFGSGSSAGASILSSPSMEKSDSKDLEEKPAKPSAITFTSSNSARTLAGASTGGSDSSILTTPYAFSSTNSDSSTMPKPSIFSSSSGASSGLSTSFSSASGSSSMPTSSLFSTMGSGSSSLVKSSLFTTSDTSSSGPVIPSLFSSTSIGSSSLASSSSSSSSSSVSSASDGIFSFGASMQSSNSSLSSGNDTSYTTTTTFGAPIGSIFETQATPSGSGVLSSSPSTGQVGSFSSSPTFGLGSSSSLAFGSSPFGSSAPSVKSPSISSVFSFSAGSGSASSASSSFAQAAVPSLFSTSSQPSASSVFGSTFGSSTSSPSTGFTFGSSMPSVSSSPIFGSQSGPAFSFASLGSTTSSFSSSPTPSMFEIPAPATGFSSGSQGNDQMNEDSMADDTNQATVPAVPTFGQPVNSPGMPNFSFSSAAQSAFQFGSHQNSSIPQNQSPFQAGGNLEFPPGGSFSLGSGGADKSARRILKPRRDKHRKK